MQLFSYKIRFLSQMFLLSECLSRLIVVSFNRSGRLHLAKIYKYALNYYMTCDDGVRVNTPCFQQGALGSNPSSRIIMVKKW